MSSKEGGEFVWWRPIVAFLASFCFLVGIGFFFKLAAGEWKSSTEPVSAEMEREIRQEVLRHWRKGELSKEPSLWNWDDGGSITKLKSTPGHLGFRITDKTGRREVFQVDWKGASYGVRAAEPIQLRWIMQEVAGEGP